MINDVTILLDILHMFEMVTNRQEAADVSLQEGMLEGKKAQGFSTFSVGAVYVCHSHQFVSNLHQVKLLNFFFLLFFFFSCRCGSSVCALCDWVKSLHGTELSQGCVMVILHLYSLQKDGETHLLNCECWIVTCSRCNVCRNVSNMFLNQHKLDRNPFIPYWPVEGAECFAEAVGHMLGFSPHVFLC